MTVEVFVNERINVEVEQGAKGGPAFLTTIMPLDSGKEKRNSEWEFPRQSWNLGYGIQNGDDMDEIRGFFYVCRGRASGFRFKDWTDYKIGMNSDGTETPKVIATGDGATTVFQVLKLYQVGSYSFARKITRLVSSPAIKVYVDGALQTLTTAYTVNVDTGKITFTGGHIPAAGKAITVVCQFDIPVRFDTDRFDAQVTWADAQAAPNLPVIELKE